MPLITRTWVKTAFLYLVAALALAIVTTSGIISLESALRYGLQIVYTHLLVVGWLTQLIFGVAWWFFPPLSPEKPRGDERPIWLVYIALNLGLLLRVAGEPLYQIGAQTAFASNAIVLSAILQELAVLVFAFKIWQRIRAPKRKIAGG